MLVWKQPRLCVYIKLNGQKVDGFIEVMGYFISWNSLKILYQYMYFDVLDSFLYRIWKKNVQLQHVYIKKAFINSKFASCDCFQLFF